MDYVRSIPALASDDAVADVPAYTAELRSILLGTDWQELDLLNGWTAAAEGGARFRRDGVGNVHVQARLITGNSGTNPSDAAFILPAGFRHTLPTFLRLPVGTNQLATAAEAYFYSSGEVAISTNNSAGSGYVSFNEIFTSY